MSAGYADTRAWESRVLPLALLVIVLVTGSWVRFAGLGESAMFGDELDHYYAAQSIRNGQGPLLPSGEVYPRGPTYTRLVAFALGIIDSPEIATRLPSAVFGVAGMIALAAVAWALGGGWAAVWAGLLLAVYPEAISQSRQARFYTYQMLWAILALYGVWRAVRWTGVDLERREDPRRTWIWGGVAALALALALATQVTTLSVIVAASLVILVGAAVDLRRFGRPALSRSPPLGIALAGCVTAFLTLGVQAVKGFPLLRQAVFVPAWAGSQAGDFRAYYWVLEGAFPWLMALLPALFLAVALRKSWVLALLLGAWFGVPFLLHSLVFPWKGERYIIAAIPGLLLLAAIGIVVSLAGLRRLLDARLVRAGVLRGPSARHLSRAALAVVAASIVVATPAVRDVEESVSGRDLRWRVAREILDEVPGAASMPLGSSMGLPALFYLGRLDFVVGTDFLESGFPATTRPGASAIRDWYTGMPVLTQPAQVVNEVGSGQRVLIAIDTPRWRFGNIDTRMMRVLSEQATELCEGRCGELRLYFWEIPTERVP